MNEVNRRKMDKMRTENILEEIKSMKKRKEKRENERSEER